MAAGDHAEEKCFRTLIRDNKALFLGIYNRVEIGAYVKKELIISEFKKQKEKYLERNE